MLYLNGCQNCNTSAWVMTLVLSIDIQDTIPLNCHTRAWVTNMMVVLCVDMRVLFHSAITLVCGSQNDGGTMC